MLRLPLKLIKRFFTIINLKEIDKILSIITLQEDTKVNLFGVCLVEEKEYMNFFRNTNIPQNQTLYIIDMVAVFPIAYKIWWDVKFISFASWTWYRGIGLILSTLDSKNIEFIYIQLEELNLSGLIPCADLYESYIDELYSYYRVYSNLKRTSIFNNHKTRNKLLKIEKELEKDMLKLMDDYYKNN
jgi:hypothetical protein